jgi:formylglycine-generating enzyme required for sulfatase activity
MQWIEGGRFLMGSDRHYPEEKPARSVQVDGFWIDRTPVTNRQFARFVEETGHVTLAEQSPDPDAYPGALPENLQPASLMFRPPSGAVDLHGSSEQWWRFEPGADWRHPTGRGSNIRSMADHPVVHVALVDVEAYAAWAGAELPTEAEWEYAARGGIEGADYAWGDSFLVGGRHMANSWQGEFPLINTLDDGWRRTSPVGTFPANGYGLVDMIGNVWEWTADWWSVMAPQDQSRHCCAVRNPRGGTESGSLPAGDCAPFPRRVLKGGSHLCAPNYCQRYRPAARHAHPVDTSTSHIGFRCIVRA